MLEGDEPEEDADVHPANARPAVNAKTSRGSVVDEATR